MATSGVAVRALSGLGGVGLDGAGPGGTPPLRIPPLRSKRLRYVGQTRKKVERPTPNTNTIAPRLKKLFAKIPRK